MYRTKFWSVFFRLLDRIFNENFKNVLETVIFSLLGRLAILSLTIKLLNCAQKLQKSGFKKDVKKRVSDIYDRYFDSGHAAV